MTTLTLPGVTDTHDPSPAEIAERFVRRLQTQVKRVTDEHGTRLETVAHYAAVMFYAHLDLDDIGVHWDVAP
jgi:hypothetical protein